MKLKSPTCETDYAFLAFESACDAVFVLAGSTIAAVNERAEVLLSTGAARLVGRSIHEILTPLPAEKSSNSVKLLFRQAEAGTPAAGTTRLLRQTDAPFWAEIAVQRLDLEGRPLLVLVRDVTERYLSAQLLERERQFVARVINDFPAIICGTDADGIATFVNTSAATITGYGIDELVGSSWWELLLPDPSPLSSPPPERESHVTTPKKEITILRKDGTKRTLEWSEIVRYNDEGQHVETIGLGNDITQLRGAASQMERAKNAAEAANRAMSDFLANMTHELRTPMNGVIGMSSLLLETNLSGQQSAYVETIRQCGAALMRLINEILELTSIENGRIDLDTQRGDISDIVDDLDALWRPKAKDKRLGFHWKLDPQIPPHFCTDFGRVKQVLSQLIANAVKFTREGGVTVCVALVDKLSDRPSLRFVVEDTGIGIPEGARPHLFEKFYQADMSTTRQYGGAGLGLTVAKSLVELMGGHMTVESEEALGSRFSAVIPIDIGQAATAATNPPRSRGVSTAKLLGDLDLSREIDLQLTGRLEVPASKKAPAKATKDEHATKGARGGEAAAKTTHLKGVIEVSEQLPVLEPKALLERLGGNEQLCKQLYEMFAQTLGEKIPLIESAIAREDLSAAAGLAHQLGGSCATVDAQRLRAQVIELEKACLRNDLSAAASMMSDIRGGASLVKEEIKGYASS